MTLPSQSPAIGSPVVEFQAIILACDEEGSGLFPLTLDTPKPLLPIANKPLLSYQLGLLQRAKFSSIMVVTFEEFGRRIRNYIAEEFPHLKVDVQVVSEVEGGQHSIAEAQKLYGIKGKHLIA